MADTVTTPGAIEENPTGRTSVWRPVVHEVIHDGVKAKKGRVIWRHESTNSNRKKATRQAFMSWASGEHLPDTPAADPSVVTLQPQNVESEGQ